MSVDIATVASFVIASAITLERIPVLGESLRGEHYYLAPGGKGTNQAVTAARQGKNVGIVGKVGGVALGRRLWRMDFTPRADLGLAMLSQGGLALTMIINVGLMLPEGGHLAALESLVIVSIVLNQMMGPAWAEGPLRRAGELRPA